MSVSAENVCCVSDVGSVTSSISNQDGLQSFFEKQKTKEITAVSPNVKHVSITPPESENLPVTRRKMTKNVSHAIGNNSTLLHVLFGKVLKRAPTRLCTHECRGRL